jgi:hypothetical protein
MKRYFKKSRHKKQYDHKAGKQYKLLCVENDIQDYCFNLAGDVVFLNDYELSFSKYVDINDKYMIPDKEGFIDHSMVKECDNTVLMYNRNRFWEYDYELEQYTNFRDIKGKYILLNRNNKKEKRSGKTRKWIRKNKPFEDLKDMLEEIKGSLYALQKLELDEKINTQDIVKKIEDLQNRKKVENHYHDERKYYSIF